MVPQSVPDAVHELNDDSTGGTPPAHFRWRVIRGSGCFGYVIVTAATETAVQSNCTSVWVIRFMVDVEDKNVTEIGPFNTLHDSELGSLEHRHC